MFNFVIYLFSSVAIFGNIMCILILLFLAYEFFFFNGSRNYRRKYVNLYKTKLDCLQREQVTLFLILIFLVFTQGGLTNLLTI